MDDFLPDVNQDFLCADLEDFQSYRTSYFDLDSCSDSEYDFMADSKFKEACDTADSQSMKTQNFDQKIEQVFKEGLYKIDQRKANKIEISSKKSKNSYIQCKKGDKKQTKDLAVNYKTLIGGIFQDPQLWNSLTQEEKTMFNLFRSEEANLANFRKLFGVQERPDGSQKPGSHFFLAKGSDQIRKLIINKISSQEMVQKILKSKRMQFSNKMATVKFLETLREGCISPQHFFCWKQT